MYVTDLADVLRAGGLRVVEQPGWKTRAVRALSGVRSVVCHHTAGAASGNAPSLGVVQNGRSDLQGPLAQLLLARDGTFYVVASGVANHAGATINDSIYGNSYALGIEAENTGVGQPWPDVQVQAYAKGVAVLARRYGFPISRVQGHKEICSPRGRKSDPAYLPGDMNGLRNLAQRYYDGTVGGGGASPQASAPAPLPKEDEMYYVDLPACEQNSDGTYKSHGVSIPLPGARCALTLIPGRDANGTRSTPWLAGIDCYTDYGQYFIGRLRQYSTDNNPFQPVPEIRKWILETVAGASYQDALEGYITYSSALPLRVAVRVL